MTPLLLIAAGAGVAFLAALVHWVRVREDREAERARILREYTHAEMRKPR